MKRETELQEVKDMFNFLCFMVVVLFCLVVPLFAFELVGHAEESLSAKKVLIGCGSILIGIWYFVVSRYLVFKDKKLVSGGGVVMPEGFLFIIPYVLIFGTFMLFKRRK